MYKKNLVYVDWLTKAVFVCCSDVNGGNLLFKKAPSQNALQCAHQPGRPAQSLSGKAYVTVNREHKIFRIKEWCFEDAFLILIQRKYNMKISMVSMMSIEKINTLIRRNRTEFWQSTFPGYVMWAWNFVCILYMWRHTPHS